jgi:hypothetical protein
MIINSSSGNVGIGTTTDSARLTVKGSGTTSGTTSLRVENTNASASFVVRDNGSVGIGTASPSVPLEVVGNTIISGSQIIRHSFGTIYYDSSGNGGGRIFGSYNYLNGEIYILPSGSNNFNFLFSPNNGMSIGGFTIGGTTGSPPAYGLAVSGSIGIGTRTPITQLDVSGSGRFTNGLTVTGSLIVSSSTTQLSGPSHIVRASTGDISLFATASSINTQTQRFRIYDPLSTVGVSDHLYIEANTADGGMYWSSNDEVIANYNQTNGRYSYGNNNLYVSSSDNRTYSPSGFVGPLIGTASWATNVLTASAATTVEVNDVPSNNATNYLSFFLANSGFRPSRVASTKFVVNPATGSMGINKSTITTGYNLDVNGSVLITGSLVVSGSIIASGSDATINSVRVGIGGGQQATNIVLGANSLVNNTTGTANIAIGYFTSTNNTIGSDNTAIGNAALTSNLSGGYNTAVGRNAGRYIADGATAITVTSQSVFLGGLTKALADSQTNQIVIGYNAIGLGSNSAVLGNDSITRTALKGSVSIGTTGSISSTLHVKGAGATSATSTLIVQNSTPTNIITVLDNGTVGIRRTPTASLDIAGTTRLSGSFDTAISGAIFTVIGSGSTQPIFTVQGSQGELFSINDSLSGSLFSVNDISGLPILEVFSDSTTLIGDYQDPMLITTKKVTMTNSGSFVVYSLPTASYDTAFFDYSIKSGSNARAGQIMAIQSGSSVNFTETTTTSFGSTTAVSFTIIVSGSNMVLTGSAATGSWTIKSIIRGL